MYAEEQLTHFDSVSVDHLASGVSCLRPSSCGKLDDCLVDEALFARIEEEPEVAPEVCEEHLDQPSLVLRPELLIELCLLDDQVVIVPECCLRIVGDGTVQLCWHKGVSIGVICLLQLHDPDIETLQVVSQHGIVTASDRD